MSHYPHHVNVRLTKEQYNVVKPNPSVAIRNLIDNHVHTTRNQQRLANKKRASN